MRPYLVRISDDLHSTVELVIEHDPADYPDGPKPPESVHIDGVDGPYYVVTVWADDAQDAAQKALEHVWGLP